MRATTEGGHVKLVNPGVRYHLRQLIDDCHMALNAAAQDGLALRSKDGYHESVEQLLGDYMDDMIRTLLPVMRYAEAIALADSLVVAAHDVAAQMKAAS